MHAPDPYHPKHCCFYTKSWSWLQPATNWKSFRNFETTLFIVCATSKIDNLFVSGLEDAGQFKNKFSIAPIGVLISELFSTVHT